MDPREPVGARKPGARTRRLNCERCGQSFVCTLDSACWCAAEPVRLPLPVSGDCLCPDCLRKLAAAR